MIYRIIISKISFSACRLIAEINALCERTTPREPASNRDGRGRQRDWKSKDAEAEGLPRDSLVVAEIVSLEQTECAIVLPAEWPVTYVTGCSLCSCFPTYLFRRILWSFYARSLLQGVLQPDCVPTEYSRPTRKPSTCARGSSRAPMCKVRSRDSVNFYPSICVFLITVSI